MGVRVCGYSLAMVAMVTVTCSSLCSPTEMMETTSTSLPRFLQSFSEWLKCSALTITQEQLFQEVLNMYGGGVRVDVCVMIEDLLDRKCGLALSSVT